MKTGLDRTLLQTKDISDQPDSKWILSLGEGVMIGCDYWDAEDGLLKVFRDGVVGPIHVHPLDTAWRLVKRDLVDLVKAEVLAKENAKAMTSLVDKINNLPPDDMRDWS
jgi:hypothetical protein